MLCDYTQNLLNTSPYSVLITAIVILLTFIYYIIKDRGLPPGPTGVPLLGVYPFLKNKNLHLQLEEYKKKYGDLFCFRVCGQLFINLGSLKLLREAHVSKSEYFNGRFTDCSLMTSIFDGEKALNGSLAQFLGDGHLAVVGFIGLFFLHLVKHPKEQEKIYKEILEVVGPDRQPSTEDKSNLPYTNAFIYEVLRSTDFFPFFPSLMCTMEANLRGYRIPKESITLVNFYSAHHDPDSYEDPFKFDPCRYLSSAGKARAELPVSFGTGKRSCLGEAYTMTQVFLFLTTAVQNFRLILPEGEEYSTNAFTLKLKLRAVPR